MIHILFLLALSCSGGVFILGFAWLIGLVDTWHALFDFFLLVTTAFLAASKIAEIEDKQ